MGSCHDVLGPYGPSALKFWPSGGRESQKQILTKVKLRNFQKLIFQLQMALESTPKVLQRTPIPILNRIGMGILWSEKIDHSKIESKGSRAHRRQVIGKLTC